MNRVITNSVNRITKHFGKTHKGVDLGWSDNENDNYVHANCKGVVKEIVDGKNRNILATGASSWGNYVLIKHPNGMYTRYAHLIKYTIPVKVGQEVDENTIVGTMGTSGVTYGRHLHFEVATGYSSATRINPEPYLSKAVYEEQTTNDAVNSYTIQRGDTLSGIANKYNTIYQKLAEYNNISNPNVISIGQVIKIPSSNIPVDFKKYIKINANSGVWCRKGIGFRYAKYKVIPNGTKCELLTRNAGTSNGYKWDKCIYNGRIVFIPNNWNKYL